MSIQVGDELLDGQVVIVSVSDDLITQIRFPNIRDGANNPLTITYNPGQTVTDIEALAQAVIDLLG